MTCQVFVDGSKRKSVARDRGCRVSIRLLRIGNSRPDWEWRASPQGPPRAQRVKDTRGAAFKLNDKHHDNYHNFPIRNSYSLALATGGSVTEGYSCGSIPGRLRKAALPKGSCGASKLTLPSMSKASSGSGRTSLIYKYCSVLPSYIDRIMHICHSHCLLPRISTPHCFSAL